MASVVTILMEHPLTLGFLTLCFLGFVRMTYEFILRLFGKHGFQENFLSGDEDDGMPPPEDSPVDDPDNEPPPVEECEEQEYVREVNP